MFWPALGALLLIRSPGLGKTIQVLPTLSILLTLVTAVHFPPPTAGGRRTEPVAGAFVMLFILPAIRGVAPACTAPGSAVRLSVMMKVIPGGAMNIIFSRDATSV